MTRFQVITEKHDGHALYLLKDMQTGALARILPRLGANCMELRLPAGGVTDPTIVPVIDDMQFVGAAATQSSRYGIPILFPWPSGIPGGSFTFENKVYSLNDPGKTGSAHHGFVKNVPWRVMRSDCDNTAAWLTCSIDSSACGEAAARYPSTFTLEVTWRLTPDRFQIIMEARNTGASAMPMAMGLHPYFTIPFGKNGTRQETRLAADVRRQWNLDAIVSVKPGSAKPVQIFLPKPTFDLAAKEGTLIGDVKFNHVFEARFDEKAVTHASVIDPANQVKLTVSASKDFGTWVFYTPPDRSAISLEPWTLAPNGFNLAATGIKEAGMLTLQAGEKWNGQVEISC